MWNELWRQTSHDFFLILPQAELALFGLYLLLADFLVAKQHKWVNAAVALVGVTFSGFSLWRLRGVPPEG